MSAEQAAGAQAPAGGVVPAATPAQAPAQTPAQTVSNQDNQQDPAWLPGRLEKAKTAAVNSLLSELGVKDSASLKANLARLSELETASLTEQEKTAKRLAELEPRAQKADRLEAAFKSVVDAKFSTFSEAQQAAIDARANGDPEKRWELMQLAEAFAGGTTSQPAQPTTPAPANTSPAAPAPPARSDALTPRQQYEALKTTDPMRANLFYQLNRAAIESSPSA